MEGDGDGWVRCERGHRHWGRFGAAGLLLHAVDDTGQVRVLLQHRAAWSHHGDTWGLPGGARHSHEEAAHAALREAAEETAIDASAVRTRHAYVDDHGGWSYTTVHADLPAPVGTALNHESLALAWVPVSEVDTLPLHPGFATTWPRLRVRPVVLLVDAANVVGATPDGWWRDRAGAAGRLLDRLQQLRGATVRMPGWRGAPGAVGGPTDPAGTDVAERDPADWRATGTSADAGIVAGVVAVLEGAAVTAGDPGWVQVHRAGRGVSGDDLLVSVAAALPASRQEVLAITADRGLRTRLTGLPGGPRVVGPGWLRAAMASVPPGGPAG